MTTNDLLLVFLIFLMALGFPLVVGWWTPMSNSRKNHQGNTSDTFDSDRLIGAILLLIGFGIFALWGTHFYQNAEDATVKYENRLEKRVKKLEVKVKKEHPEQ